MKISRADKIRILLVKRLYTSFYVMHLDEWIRMLRKHSFAVDAPYLPRAALMTLIGALTSLIRAYENSKYGPEIADVKVRRPLFILGTGGVARRIYTICSPRTNNSHTPTRGRHSARTPFSPPNGTRRSCGWRPRYVLRSTT